MNTQEILDYITNEKPIACYLGRIEMQAMSEEFAKHCIYSIKETNDSNLPSLEYKGCPIYEVLTGSHVGFA